MGTFSKRQPVSATLVAVLLAVVLCVVGFVMYSVEAATADKGGTGKPAPSQTDFQRLEGKWVRQDGGYVLELRNVKKDGSLTAAYSNPRPIRVFRAEASRKDGTLCVVVELRDVNYPGSTYTLQYDPVSDRLRGTYFQAVQRQTFEIEFVRVR
jgi:hypothetical protein